MMRNKMPVASVRLFNVLVLIGLAASVTAICGKTSRSFAAERATSAWSETLREINGVWVSDTSGQAKLFFSPQISGVVDTTGPSKIRPLTVNTATGDITFQLIPTDVDRLAVARGAAILAQNSGTLEEAPWTLRRVWDKQHKNFSLTLYGPSGTAISYGFVRALTPQEEASFASIEPGARQAEADLAARIAATKQQQAVRQQSKDKTVASLSSPEVRAAADRLGIGADFYAASPTRQAEVINDALRTTAQRLKNAQTELDQLNKEKPVSDASASRIEKRKTELTTFINNELPWQADLMLVDTALKASNPTAPRPDVGMLYGSVNPNIPSTTTVIKEIKPGSVAERAGLKVGDALLLIEGKTVFQPDVITRTLENVPLGGRVALVIARNNEQQEVELEFNPPAVQ